MNEQAPIAEDTSHGSKSAGEILKAARLSRGVHIAALSAAIKVPVQKLEALEADRLDALPDATFARALAKTVCRFLKVDPQPVLSRLPAADSAVKLEHVAAGLNQPFRDGQSLSVDGVSALAALLRPAALVPILLILAALAVWLLPAGSLRLPGMDGDRGEGRITAPVTAPGPDSAASEAAPPVPWTPEPLEPAASPATGAVTPPPVPLTPAPAPAPAAGAAAPATAVPAPPAAAAANRPVLVQASQESWLEARDASGRVLISRLLTPGESVGLDGSFPLSLRVGNAAATQVTVRGTPFDIKPYVRNNVAGFDIP